MSETAHKTIPVTRFALPRETGQQMVFADPMEERFAAFARDFEREMDSERREKMMARLLAKIKTNEIPGLLIFLQSATPPELAQDLSRRLIRQWTDADLS